MREDAAHDDQYELTIRNQYMFNRVMTDEAICRMFLKRVIGKEIDTLEYKNKEQSFEPRPGSRGVRLDLFARGGGRLYDIELQVLRRGGLGKRYRYYQGAIDTEMLGKGEDFDALPESYIIFVCDHDPFGHGHPVYTFEHTCREDETVQVADDAHWIALNCKAYDKVQDRELRDFMEYLSDGKISDDALVASIAKAVDEANEDRRWVGKVFSVSTMAEDMERELRIWRRMGLKEGRAEGLEQGLQEGREQGREQGLQQGLEQGRIEGAQESEALYSALIERLFADGRIDEIRQAAADPDYRCALLHEYGLEPSEDDRI